MMAVGPTGRTAPSPRHFRPATWPARRPGARRGGTARARRDDGISYEDKDGRGCYEPSAAKICWTPPSRDERNSAHRLRTGSLICLPDLIAMPQEKAGAMNHKPTAGPNCRMRRGKETCDTLQLWTQIVGKIRLAQTPWLNHSWHRRPLYSTARGLTTSPIPDG